MFNTVQEAIHWLEIQIKFKPKTDLDRMREAYKLLGVDLSHIKKVHVAGTNGKGSVCSMISHILMAAGYKVGTFTSPYLISFNERIRFQMENMGDDDLLELTNMIFDFNETFGKTYGEKLSFFELLTLMSFLYFKHKEVDYMVMEVGLGGLLDATNILNYDLSLITSIGFDHMKQLGNTLESIAYNKLGILKEKNHLITTVDPSLHDFFTQHVKDVKVSSKYITSKDVSVISDYPLSISYKGQTYHIPLSGSYQILNSTLSIEAVQTLIPGILHKTIQKGLSETTWPGRLEEIEHHIFIDGAHNTHAIDALVETAKTTFKDNTLWILFSALGDKDISGMLDKLHTISNNITITSFPDPRFQDLKELAKPFTYKDDAFIALADLKEKMDDQTVILITGSLHFIGYIKKHYQK